MGDEHDWALDWARDHYWRVVLASLSVVSGIVATGHAAFYWRIGTSPSAVGISYGELAGQALLAAALLLSVFFLTAALFGWLVYTLALLVDAAPDIVRTLRSVSWSVRVRLVPIAAVALGAWYGLVTLPQPAAVGGLVALGVAVALTRLFRAGAGAPARGDADAFPWQPAWAAGVVAAGAALCGTVAFVAAGPTVGWFLPGLLAGLLVGILIGGIALARAHRKRTLPTRLNRGAALATVVGGIVGFAALTGLAVLDNSRLVLLGRTPDTSLQLVAGAPIRCVRVHWVGATPSPPLPEHALRLGSAAGHVVLFDAASGPLFPPTGTVHTAAAPAERCRRP